MINKKNFSATVTEEVTQAQFQSYKQMFNSLQEGILIIDGPKVDREDKECGVSPKDFSFSFTNQLATKIF